MKKRRRRNDPEHVMEENVEVEEKEVEEQNNTKMGTKVDEKGKKEVEGRKDEEEKETKWVKITG